MTHSLADHANDLDALSADPALCAAEPIRIPGSIQPYGALLTLQIETLAVLQVGGNTADLFGEAPAKLIGRKAADLFSRQEVACLRRSLDPTYKMSQPAHVFSRRSRVGGAVVDVLAHQISGVLVLELEPRSIEEPDDPLALVQTMIQRLQHAATTRPLHEAIVAEVRAVTGFDRVMLYRFMADASGVVVAEECDTGTHAYLGLHFPESDIPSQARALYLENRIRAIPDATYASAPLMPDANPLDGQPLDLSQSVLRSVSKVHLQYLANMGVAASLSLSLVISGRLWGLIACHHGVPRHLPYRLRLALELFVDMACSLKQTNLLADELAADENSARLHQGLVARLSQETDLRTGLKRLYPSLLELIPAGGLGLWIDGSFDGIGNVPDGAQIAALVAWLNETVADGLFYTQCLAEAFPPAAAFADVASGILTLSLSRTPRDYVIWFRPEVIRTVTWAGDPHKVVSLGPDGAQLSPRGSFAAWKQSVDRHAEPWSVAELRAANRLRVSLLEVVLRHIDQIATEREVARLRQQHLLGELDQSLTQWQETAQALKQETERRTVAENELSEVLRHTMNLQEAERLRIARELHDTLGQSLTLMQFAIDNLTRVPPSAADYQRRLALLKQMTLDAGQEVSRLAWEVRPTALDDCGLQIAVENLLESWSAHAKLQFDLHVTIGDQRLSSGIETTLFRVLQEALNNIARHAKATRVDVMLGITEGQVTLVIEDDGIGFDQSGTIQGKSPAGRLGLLGMRERVGLVGGTFEIESAMGHGTVLLIHVPL
jgi:light-regulated signal transduction histidine kinase (bacteriophytochrome)